MRIVVLLMVASCVASAVAETRALVVAGLGGGLDYETDFQRQAKATSDAIRDVASDVVLLLGELAQRERLRVELRELGTRSQAADTLVVVLIGHGSHDDRNYRFNVPGRDVTGEELAGWLDSVAGTQLVVVATSASGSVQELLAGERRTVITATRSGGERNATVFAGYFTEALSRPEADTDKDGYVSAREAFRFTESRVAAHYEDRNEMATEHPQLAGSEPAVALARLQERPAFDRGSAADQGRLATLEADIEALRADKDNVPVDAYYAELQRLLLEVAMLRRQLDEDASP